MEHTAWSDERQDDATSSIDPRDARFDQLHRRLVWVGIGINVGIASVIAAILARG